MEFEATVDAKYFKFFWATLEAFSHLGEIVCIEAQNGQLVLSTVDTQRTAQGFTQISRDTFKNFKLLNRGSTDSLLRCTVSNKNFSGIFKKNMSASASNMIQECQIRIVQPNSEGDWEKEARIFMKLVFKNGVVKKNTLMYYEGSPLVMYFKPTYRYKLECHPLLLKNYMTRFDSRTDDILLIVTPSKLVLESSHERDELQANGSQRGSVRNSVKKDDRIKATVSLPAVDFVTYPNTQQHHYLIVNLRQLKTVIDYMENLNSQLCLEFDNAGLPLLCKFSIEGEVISYVALQTETRPTSDREEEGISFISDIDTAPTINHAQSSNASSAARYQRNSRNATASETGYQESSSSHSSLSSRQASHQQRQPQSHTTSCTEHLSTIIVEETISVASSSKHHMEQSDADSNADTVIYNNSAHDEASGRGQTNESTTSSATSSSSIPHSLEKNYNEKIRNFEDENKQEEPPLFYSSNAMATNRNYKSENPSNIQQREEHPLSSLNTITAQQRQAEDSNELNSPPSSKKQRLSALERIRLLQSRNKNRH